MNTHPNPLQQSVSRRLLGTTFSLYPQNYLHTYHTYCDCSSHMYSSARDTILLYMYIRVVSSTGSSPEAGEVPISPIIAIIA